MFAQVDHSGISCGKSVRSCRVQRCHCSSLAPVLQQIAIRFACMFDLLDFPKKFHLPLCYILWYMWTQLDFCCGCVSGEVHSDTVPHHLCWRAATEFLWPTAWYCYPGRRSSAFGSARLLLEGSGRWGTGPRIWLSRSGPAHIQPHKEVWECKWMNSL